MKRLLFLVCLLASVRAFAQVDGFVKADNGDYFVEGSWATDIAPEVLYERFVLTYKPLLFDEDFSFMLNSEIPGKEIDFSSAFVTKIRILPFPATVFYDGLGFRAKFEFTEGTVKYYFNKLVIRSGKRGMSNSEEVIPLGKMYLDIANAEAKIQMAEQNANLTKKERSAIIKEANNDLKDRTESVTKAYEELMSRIGTIQSNICF